MEVWKNIVLLVSVFGMLGFGFFLMTRLDRFLEENGKTDEKENGTKEPSCVMLTGNMSDEEIVTEIRNFREKHESSRIVLYDGADAPPDCVSSQIDRKL